MIFDKKKKKESISALTNSEMLSEGQEFNRILLIFPLKNELNLLARYPRLG